MTREKLICTSIDDAYLWPWMVMVYSAVVNCEEKNFHIILANINGMLSEKSILLAKEFTATLKLGIEIVEIDTTLNPKFQHQFNLTVYARLFLMDVLENDFLWLDADLLLLPGWDQIFSELGDNPGNDVILCGVNDSQLSLQKFAREGNRAFIKSKGRYVNSGVIKIFAKKWQKFEKEEDWQEMALNLEKYQINLPDQDVLNYLCADHVSILPAGFNFIVGDEVSFQERIYIKHYAGSPKPWKLDQSGKESLLGIQGVKYFSPKDWITQSSDAFTHYPMYWQVEDELIDFLRKSNLQVAEKCVKLKFNTVMPLDLMLRLKISIMHLIAKRYR